MSFRKLGARTVTLRAALMLCMVAVQSVVAQQSYRSSSAFPIHDLSAIELEPPEARMANELPTNYGHELTQLNAQQTATLVVPENSRSNHLELSSVNEPSAAVASLWQPTQVLAPVYSEAEEFGASCDSVGSCELGTSCCNSRIRVPPVFNCRANQCRDGVCWLTEYYQRASTTCSNENAILRGPNNDSTQFSTWWDELVHHAAGLAQQPRPLRVDEIIQSALVNSPHIQVAATDPHIQRTFIVEEQAEFDWRAFLETQYDDLNDPIGNTLTTGNNDDRFKQQEFYARGGLRRKNGIGGEFDVSERIGTLRNNSRFLLPPDQGNSRLELNYTQPLLNGSGRYVNESLIVLAKIDYNTAGDRFLVNLQDHLLLVTEAYWELYRSRANYFQRIKLLRNAEIILENLRGRSEVDSLDRQVLRATAAVANRKSEIARATTSIRNSESQLRLLVNDPNMLNSSCMEFLPADKPTTLPLETSLAKAISTALGHRPDISEAIRELRATTVRLGVAKNDLLPQLDLLISTYVAGLNGNTDVYASYVNQFSDGRPGFTVGLQFEVPVGNRGARARHERRKWELTRAVGQFRAVAETAMTEVEVAVREVSTTYREMTARYEAMHASNNETDYLIDRWKTLPNVDDSSTLLLEDLLDSQERLTDEEDAFVRAQVSYAISLIKLRQTMGTLMQVGAST